MSSLCRNPHDLKNAATLSCSMPSNEDVDCQSNDKDSTFVHLHIKCAHAGVED